MPTYDVWNAPDVVDHDDYDDLDDDAAIAAMARPRWSDGPPPGSKASAPTADWEQAWEQHVLQLGKDELKLEPIEVGIMALQFDEEFRRKRIAEGRLEGAELRAARPFDGPMAQHRKTLETAKKGSEEYFNAFMEVGRLENERDTAVHLAEFAGQAREAVRNTGRDHARRAEELLERIEGLNPAKFPERRRRLLREYAAERLAAGRAEIAEKLMYVREQAAAIEEVRKGFGEREAQLLKIIQGFQRKIERVDAELRKGNLAFDQAAELRGERAALAEQMGAYQKELRRHRDEGWNGSLTQATQQAVRAIPR